MFKQLAIIGAPSSAGAYAPGQEKAPMALRAAGLLEFLAARASRAAGPRCPGGRDPSSGAGVGWGDAVGDPDVPAAVWRTAQLEEDCI